MKKRAKIITTIASLCLAVALMAFGVYAATQVTFGITSKVSFTVADVFVTIDGTAKLGEVTKDTHQYVSYTTTAGGKVAKVPNDVTTDTWTVDADSTEEGNQAIEYASNDTVTTIIIRVTNDGNYSVDVNISALVFEDLVGTYRDATYVVWDASANSGAGDYAAAARFANHSAAETTYTSGDWAFTNTFEVLAGKYVEITLVRTLEDLSTNIDNQDSVTGNIVVTKHVVAP